MGKRGAPLTLPCSLAGCGADQRPVEIFGGADSAADCPGGTGGSGAGEQNPALLWDNCQPGGVRKSQLLDSRLIMVCHALS